MKAMSKKRKTVLLLAATAAALVLVIVLSLLRWHAFFELRDFRASSNTDAALGEALPSLSDYLPMEGEFGQSSRQSADGSRVVTVSSFPDPMLGSPRVTAVSLMAGAGEDYHILGVHVDDGAASAYTALEAHGYRVTRGTSSSIIGERGRIRISFTLTEGKITAINARVMTTNLFGVQY